MTFPAQSTAGCLNDMYTFQIQTNSWLDLKGSMKGNAPNPRVGHGFVSDGQKLYIFGGTCNGSEHQIHVTTRGHLVLQYNRIYLKLASF